MSDHLTGTTFEERAAEQLVKPFQRQAIPNAVDGTVGHYWKRFEGYDRAGLRRMAATSAPTRSPTCPSSSAASPTPARPPARRCTSPPTRPRRTGS